jgi:hypothetical protein
LESRSRAENETAGVEPPPRHCDRIRGRIGR